MLQKSIKCKLAEIKSAINYLKLELPFFAAQNRASISKQIHFSQNNRFSKLFVSLSIGNSNINWVF